MSFHCIYIFLNVAGISTCPTAAKLIFRKQRFEKPFLRVRMEMEKNCADIGDLNNIACQFARASSIITELLSRAISHV